MNRALRISSCLNDEILKIRQKFLNADCPLRFINSVIKQSNDKLSEKSDKEDDYILLSHFFEIEKQVILTEVSYCENETILNIFLIKFHKLNNNLYEIKTKWITKKMRNLFHLKSNDPLTTCAKYEGEGTCKENYIGEMKRNVQIRWKEQSGINKVSEPSRHLKSNPMHAITWKVLMF